MRPIDADALIEKCGDWYVEEGTESGFIGTLKNLLSTMPTIQPEKAQLSKEGTTKGATSDLISKTETVEHLRRLLEATVPNTDYDEGFVDGVEFGVSTVSTMPTIRPDVPDINNGDLISRQQAIDALDCINGAEEVLRSLPSAQPEPHEGEWEQVSAQRYFMSASYFYRCSACGVNNVRNTNYCPNCGAKMTISTK